MAASYIDQEDAADENPESQDILDVYLAETSKKQFNKYVVNVINQIDGYYKLDVSFGEESPDANQRELDEKDINDYVKVVKSSCFEINA